MFQDESYTIAMQLYFVRHGQSINNPHWSDPDDRLGITHIYTSLVERAVHTASITARRLNVPFKAWVDIHESGGIFGRDGETKLQGLPGKARVWFEAHFPELSLPENLDGAGWRNRPRIHHIAFGGSR
jgi:broad specificity phosphatase PhoE